MALTLTQGNMYSTTELDRKVVDYLVKDDRIMEVLPFEALLGNSLTFDIVATRSGANFYAVNDTWVEGTVVLSQDTVTLKILGGDADIDNFLLDTRSNKMDLKGQVLSDKVLGTREKFLDTFYYGDATTNTKEFSGLQKLISSSTYNTIPAGSDANGAACSIEELRQTIDMIRGWRPTIMGMSKRMRRKLSVYLDSIGDKFPAGRDEFGRHIQTFDGLEIMVSDHILDTQTSTSSGYYSASTGDDHTSIFILTFAPQACCGVQGSAGLKTVPLGDLETKDAQRYRIKWYCALKFENLRSSAKYDGIISTSAVSV